MRAPGPGPAPRPEAPGAHSLDGLDPLVFLLLRGGRDPVHHVVPLDHAAVRLRLAGFDELPLVVGDVKLKAVLGNTEEARWWVRAARGPEAPPLRRKGHRDALTGFRGSSTSRMLRFSRGIIPRGSLS